MAQKDLCVVILAGGSGTRFWPMSRQDRPKQFLNIVGDGSLLQATVKRVASEVAADRIYVVTNRQHRAQVQAQLKAFHVPPGISCRSRKARTPRRRSAGPRHAFSLSIKAR